MAPKKLTPIPDSAKDMLAYDPHSGLITWRVSSGTRSAGSQAGGCSEYNRSGGLKYIRIQLNKRLFFAHRIAWFLHYGEQPPEIIDHVDNDSTNNRIANLRPATYTQNKQNSRGHRDTPSGIKNVYWRNDRGRWAAVASTQGRRVTIGIFKNLFEAREAIVEFRNKHHGDFANHGMRCNHRA